jgi:PhnB protein
MQSRLNPYISFKDNARQAMQFYQSVFGGKLSIARSKNMARLKIPAKGTRSCTPC